jgi:hypothetical protein
MITGFFPYYAVCRNKMVLQRGNGQLLVFADFESAEAGLISAARKSFVHVSFLEECEIIRVDKDNSLVDVPSPPFDKLRWVAGFAAARAAPFTVHDILVNASIATLASMRSVLAADFDLEADDGLCDALYAIDDAVCVRRCGAIFTVPNADVAAKLAGIDVAWFVELPASFQ